MKVLARPAATLDERTAALALLLADTSDVDRLADDVAEVAGLAEAGAIDLAGLFVTVAGGDGTVAGATLATPGLGGACDLFPPRLTVTAPPDVAGALLDAAARFAAAAGCRTAQAFADPVRADDAAALSAAGFDRTCELHTLRRDCTRPIRESVEDFAPNLSLTRETRPRFLAAQRASYGDSRDAPDVRGTDPDADFAAHERSDGFRPDLCRLATAGGRDTGLILVAVREEGGGAVWDVCYLGVDPACRGRGVGSGLLRGVLVAARDAGAAAVTCAVDAANAPARRLYAAAGFTETGRRVLFVRRLHPEAAAGGGTGNAPVR